MNSKSVSVNQAGQLVQISQGGRDCFSLKLDGDNRLESRQVLRDLPGKRMTCLADWEGVPVIAKLFMDPQRAKIHWQRELRGARSLAEANIATAPLAWFGETGVAGVFAVVYEYLAEGRTLATMWREADDSQRQSYLKLVLTTLAAHHLAGITQQDLHLDNFFYQGGRLYTLDGADIRQHPAPLDARQAADNIARFWAQLYPEYDEFCTELLPDYLTLNALSEELIAGIRKRIVYWRRQRRDQFLAKIFRECSAFVSHHQWRRFSVCARHWASPEFEQFLENPDRWIDAGILLKRGNTCTVAKIRIDGLPDMVVKRYNIKNWRHGLNRLFRPSRAAISWRNAHRLTFYGIETPEPVALLEQRCGPLRRKAYFITRYTEGHDCLSYFAGEQSEGQRNRMMQKISGILGQLARQKISHGDMKGSNFLCTQEQVQLIDLDAMREHHSQFRFLAAWRRDISRLCRNWPAQSDISRFFSRFVQPDRLQD